MSAPGRVAVVTGAARGIGRATAAALAGNGFRVALVDVRSFEMAGTAALVREAGSEALALEGDVTSLATAERLAATVLAAWSRIDVLVNNAGISQPKGLLDITEEEWDRHPVLHDRRGHRRRRRAMGELTPGRTLWAPEACSTIPPRRRRRRHFPELLGGST